MFRLRLPEHVKKKGNKIVSNGKKKLEKIYCAKTIGFGQQLTWHDLEECQLVDSVRWVAR